MTTQTTPFYETKGWWKSKTILTGIVGALFSILSILGLLPEGISTEMTVEVILGTVSLFAIIFRTKATTVVTLTETSPSE